MIQPIKTPEEMLAEMAGIPRMAAGKAVVGQFDRAIAGAVAKFKQLYGKSPSAQEMEALKSHVQGLSSPTSPILRSGKGTEARAQFELGTDLNLINPDTARDPFLTKMQLDRTPKGTQLRPKTFDISDPNVTKNIEERQMSGLMDEDIPEASQRISSTPSADYFGEVSSNIENAALQGGAFDMLKAEFVKKFGRYPNADETNQMIADYNIMRQQYGPKGISVVGERPRTARGMEEFRAEARNEGIEESALTNPPADYPKYLKNELAIQRGELPSIKIPKAKKKNAVEPTDFYVDDEGNLVKVFPTMKAAGGQITPEEMMHQMIIAGQEPQRFAAGGRPGIKELDAWTASQKDPYDFAPKFQAYEPGFRERATDAIAPYLEKIGMEPRRAYEQASTITGRDTLMSPATIFDPIAPFEAAQELAQGNPVGAGLTLAGFIPGAAAATKAIKKTKKRK
jgi:hypothetical protein